MIYGITTCLGNYYNESSQTKVYPMINPKSPGTTRKVLKIHQVGNYQRRCLGRKLPKINAFSVVFHVFHVFFMMFFR